MKISIITVCFNSEKTIEDTIKSVCCQTYKNIEYIIIDGGSTDRTCDIINSYISQISIFVSEPDNGIYDAMNKGLDMATGDYLLFLGSDDHLMSSNIIERVMARINNTTDIFYGDVLRPIRNDLYCGRYNRFKLAVKNISHQAIFYPRSIYSQYQYDQTYKVFADYYLNIKLFPKYKFTYLNMCISYFNDDNNSTSGNIVDINFERIRRKHILSHLGLLPLIYSEVYHFLRNLIKSNK